MTNERKIALITGGSRGLGRSTALHLADRGIDVILTYLRNADAANEVRAAVEHRGARAATLQLDTGKVDTFGPATEAIRELLQSNWERRSFDFLVNNAGHGHHASFAETEEADFDRLVDVHLKGVFFLTQSLLPLIADGGQIVNLSTGLTRFALPGYSAYACMKGAVEVLTRYLAKELGSRHISVNTIAPGAIETDFGGGVVRDNKDLNEMIASTITLGRVGRPDDIGGVLSALLAGETKWINAQRIEASGGQMI